MAAIRHPSSNFARICILFLVAMLSSCSAGSSPDKKERAVETPRDIVRVDRETCRSIFDKESITELRKKPLPKGIWWVGEMLHFQTVGKRMAKGMKTYGNMETCLLLGSERTVLLRTPTDWGPRSFPNEAKEQGKKVFYESADGEGQRRVHRILVDCDKDWESKVAKKKLPIQIDLESRYQLTSRTLADILNRTAQILVKNIKCKNTQQITYEKPESVKFTPAP